MVELSTTVIQRQRRWYRPADLALAKRTYPALLALERPALLLKVSKAVKDRHHPLDSKLGGAFGWPTGAPALPSRDGAFFPVIQLRRQDFPLISFPDCTDLLQVFWRPKDLLAEIAAHRKWITTNLNEDVCHTATSSERGPAVFWRSSEDLTDIYEPPPIQAKDRFLVPEGSWAITGLLVREFPIDFRLGVDLAPGVNFDSCLSFSQAKVGGHPTWTAAGATEPACSCGASLTFVLSLSTLFDNGKCVWHNPSKLFEPYGGSWMLFACTKCSSRPSVALSRLY